MAPLLLQQPKFITRGTPARSTEPFLNGKTVVKQLKEGEAQEKGREWRSKEPIRGRNEVLSLKMGFIMEFAENLILRMMEDPKERDRKFREHLYTMKDRCKKTKEMWALPIRPYGFWTFDRHNAQIFWDAQISQLEACTGLQAPLMEAYTGFNGSSVFFTLPVDAMSPAGQMRQRKAMRQSFRTLAMAGVKGVLMEIWWGIVERDAPRVTTGRGTRVSLNSVLYGRFDQTG
ncbi:hypothetical protein RJ639_029208 [Escallonia herrerae]|uniref:Beta-amylase n=1 Tax=Escallonia herrerae TaxID=1293975 RepID=A0AA88X9P1_9ASTE|nr:hypothetical protein RJ639_029208 [Escallonia herrerae]